MYISRRICCVSSLEIEDRKNMAGMAIGIEIGSRGDGDSSLICGGGETICL